MGIAQSRASAGGTFRPVGYEQPGRRVRTDGEIDLQNLSEEEQEVVEAESFVVFGKANIEQWNDPGPGEDHLYIEMDALEEKIDQLLAIDNISFGHQDVRVGEPLESYELETDAVIHLDKDQSLHFDAGDELRTQVVREGEPLPDGSGSADEDALWLTANIFGREDPRGSRFSQKVRLGAYYGDLDGFSVTIDKLEMTPTEEGVRTHEVDFLAVTIGSDELIKNPGSSFGVAEFQALFGEVPTGLDGAAASDAVSPESGPAEEGVRGQTVRSKLMGSIFENLLGSSKDALASQAIQESVNSGIELQAAAESVAGDDADTIHAEAEEKLSSIEEDVSDLASQQDDMDADGMEDAVSEVADEYGLDKEVVMDMLEEAQRMQEEVEGEADNGDGEGEDEDDEDDDEPEQMGEDRVLELIEDQLNERLPEGNLATAEEIQQAVDGLATADELEEQLQGLGESISSDIGDHIESQMETGSTPGPTGGGASFADLESQAEEWADELPGAETGEAGGD